MPAKVTVALKDLPAKIEKDLKALGTRFQGAIEETISDAQGIVWKRVPFAFGELHNGIHPEPEVHPTKLVSDAPHAAPVEVGSIPHMPPVEPLQRWAELQGFDDPESAGWAIATKISREGTRPQHYMRGSLPEIREALDRNMRKAAAEGSASSGSSAQARRQEIGTAQGSASAVAAKYGVSASTVRRIRGEIAATGQARGDTKIRIR